MDTIWTSGGALMPAWGFYPQSASYGGTKPLDSVSAWRAGKRGEGTLTWVAEFPSDGIYNVWLRRYGGYGQFRVSIDEEPVTGGRGGPTGGRYVWEHKGVQKISAGSHHVDISLSVGMLDAVLFTRSEAFEPDKNKLPPPVRKPVLRALRNYRDDSSLKDEAGVRQFVVGQVPLYKELLYDWLPKEDELIDSIKLWGSANQYVTGTFVARFLEGAAEVKLSLQKLVGPNGWELGSNQIDLRVVHLREREVDLFFRHNPKALVAELLLRDDRTGLPPKGRQGGFGGGSCTTSVPSHQSRQFWITIHVPAGSPPGSYKGNILLSVTGAPKRDLLLPIEVTVLPIDLQSAEGYYSIYHLARPLNPKHKNHVTPKRYLSELKDQVSHGLNSTTLYGGFNTLLFAKEAGMTKPPCIMVWPDKRAFNWINEAKRNGLGGLLFYGVDEPKTAAAIKRCRREAERRRRLGLSMMTAINSREAQLATRDVIDYPVYNIYVFSGKDNKAVLYARKKGFKPISYWMTSTPFPLSYRALTGLYNKSCGYLGSIPWSYQDVTDKGLYDPHKTIHKVSYPDEYGQPIPTLCWEAHRAGIDDVRYLEALERAIAVAQRHLGEPGASAELGDAVAKAWKVRRKYFESIEGRWFEYLCGLQAGDLDVARRAFADAIVAINEGLKKEESKGIKELSS